MRCLLFLMAKDALEIEALHSADELEMLLGESIEQRVERLLQPENLLIETIAEDGKWCLAK